MLHLCDSLDRFFFMRIFQMKEQESIRNIKGIGEKTEKLLAKLGITTVGDFLRYYPREYDEYTEPVGVSQVTAGKKCAVMGRITGKVGVRNTGRLTIVTATLKEENSFLQLTWYNMPFLRNNGNGQKRAKDHGATGDFQKRRLQGAASQSLPHLRADKGINQ